MTWKCRDNNKVIFRIVMLLVTCKSFQLHYGPGVNSASTWHEYQESSWGGKGRPARNAITAICEVIVQKFWEPRRLTTPRAFTACYSDSFTFFLLTCIPCSLWMSQIVINMRQMLRNYSSFWNLFIWIWSFLFIIFLPLTGISTMTWRCTEEWNYSSIHS
jgi:hypothetical protein